MSNSQHISTACNEAGDLEGFNANELLTIVGEWTPAMTDCAKYLNGRGVGSRYDGSFPGSARVGSCSGLTGSGSTFSGDYKTFLRQTWEAQVSLLHCCWLFRHALTGAHGLRSRS
jgi:glucan 1,3-beta-glucosidase